MRLSILNKCRILLDLKSLANFRSKIQKFLIILPILSLNCGNGKEIAFFRRINRIFKLRTGLKLFKIMAISAFALVFNYSKWLKNSDLGLCKGCLRLAVKCCSGQRLLHLICNSKQSYITFLLTSGVTPRFFPLDLRPQIHSKR